MDLLLLSVEEFVDSLNLFTGWTLDFFNFLLDLFLFQTDLFWFLAINFSNAPMGLLSSEVIELVLS